MTTSSVGSLAQDLHGILSSFGSMLEGVYHVDEELAADIAEKFADRLRSDVRTIYAEMTAEISEGLKNPPKPKRRRRKTTKMAEVDPILEEDIPRNIGTEELPSNDHTLLNSSDIGDPDILAANLLNSDRVTNRSTRPAAPTSSGWDNENPTMRRIR